MSEKSDNVCIELHAMIDDADRRITDSNANRFGAGENAKNGPCAPPSPSGFAGDTGGCPPDVKRSTETGRVNGEAARTFSFGPFHLIPTQRLLLEAGKPLRLGSRALEILIALVERHGELVTKEELIARVWPNVFVESSNLTVHIAALRRVLGDGLNGNRYLVNIPGRGYEFVAPVSTAVKKIPRSGQRSGLAGHLDTRGVHGLSARSVDSLQSLAGRQEAKDTKKVAQTRGFDRDRCARCPLAKVCEPRVFYN
jgi:DNA-binding winged helix-turn-helix (wHTH) protein